MLKIINIITSMSTQIEIEY